MPSRKKKKEINWSAIIISATIAISIITIAIIVPEDKNNLTSNSEQNTVGNNNSDSNTGGCGCGGGNTVNSKDLEYKKAKIDGNYQTVEVEVQPSAFGAIIVQKGIPVEFNLKAKSGVLSGCNNAIIIPDFNIEKDLTVGNNIIEFTPSSIGEFSYTCWMGMIKSYIVVVDDINNIDESIYKVINY